jgi:hypothetical protein
VTWKQFKEALERLGVRDDDEIGWIDVTDEPAVEFETRLGVREVRIHDAHHT